MTLLFLGSALAIIAFFILFSTTRKAQSQGVLLPTSGVIRVMPQRGQGHRPGSGPPFVHELKLGRLDLQQVAPY
ncbi:hypothetical protein [Janthinobacterium svalbardensis]|uniref:hypothetical protein n=1 Tax=Janthinobacterium svalbardensis TaxID=368607 RepID=UPI002FCDBD60